MADRIATDEVEQLRSLAITAAESELTYYSGPTVIDTGTFYLPVVYLAADLLDARRENERLREALRAAGLAPSLVDAISKGEPSRTCPAGHGNQCCGYPAACRAALSGEAQHDG